MNKIFVLLLFTIIAVSLSTTPVFAQEQASAGITPDNFLYGLDVAIDNLRLALTFGDLEKARLSLEIAEERLLEVKAMIEQNKLPEAQAAQAEHDNNLAVTETAVEQITRENAEDMKRIKGGDNTVNEVKTETAIYQEAIISKIKAK